MLNNFGSELKLCFEKRKIFQKLEYHHWFVTDGKWTIEFEGDYSLECNILVHCNPKTGHTIDRVFPKTEDVIERMRKVCGATNYSLALRNCEHVARYITYGGWHSFQTVGDGILKKKFVKYMSENTKAINTFPEELRPSEELEHWPLYLQTHVEMCLQWETYKEALTLLDTDAYNIVVLGPTGAGKSTLINNLFNLTVCKTGGSAQSVTQQIQFHRGSTEICENGNVVSRRVNVIDTIGKCHKSAQM